MRGLQFGGKPAGATARAALRRPRRDAADDDTEDQGAEQREEQRHQKGEHRRLRAEWRRGRISLVIGLAFLVVCLSARELLASSGSAVARILAEGFLIAGWVALWGPIEVFLYGWWPIAGRRRLLASLALLDVEVRPIT